MNRGEKRSLLTTCFMVGNGRFLVGRLLDESLANVTGLMLMFKTRRNMCGVGVLIYTATRCESIL
jgi:hypothetical protein